MGLIDLRGPEPLESEHPGTVRLASGDSGLLGPVSLFGFIENIGVVGVVLLVKVRAIHPLMWVAAGPFVVHFTLGPIQDLLVG